MNVKLLDRQEPPFSHHNFAAINTKRMYMNGNVTFDSLPSAIEELAGKVDYIINLLGTKIEKREEIPKYLNTEKALAHLKNIGFSMSKSKLYKLFILFTRRA